MTDPIELVIAQLRGVKPHKDGYVAFCPKHPDGTKTGRRSLKVDRGRDGQALMYCFAGCETADICRAIGLDVADLFPDNDRRGPTRATIAQKPRTRTMLERPAGTVAEYDYAKDGALLFRVFKIKTATGKTFRQWSPHPDGGWWEDIRGVERVLYRHDEIVTADPGAIVFNAEGEKDVEALRGFGLLATTSPMGAGKWQDAYARTIAGHPVAIIPDNDDAGRDHAHAVAASLSRAGCAVKILTLPDLPDKGDISDWIAAGHGADELVAIYAGATDWKQTGRSQNTHNPQNETEPLPWEEPTPLADMPRPPFPTNVLPTVIAQFVEELANETQTPPALAGMMTLSALAIGCQKRVAVEVRGNWVEPTNIYTATGLDSGNRKSAVTRAVAAPIREYEQEKAREAVKLIAVADSERRILEERLKKTEKRAADAEGDEVLLRRAEAHDLAKQLGELPKQKPPRFLSDDVTTQKLAAMMADNGGRMGVISPEGGFFDILSGRYSKDGKSPDLQLFLMAHAGDDLPIDRLGREGEYLTAPALTLGVAVQTHVIRGLAGRPALRGTGGLARLGYAMPESFVGRRLIEPDPMSDATRDRYAEIVLGIFALTPETEADGSPRARRLKLSDDAYRVFIAFARDLEPRLGPWGDLAHVADWAAKLAGLVARVAGIFHTVIAVDQGETPWHFEISDQTVRHVIRLADDFLVPHALAAFVEMGIDPTVEAARLCRGAIERNGWDAFSRRDLHQVLKRRYPNPDEMDAPLGLLVRHGYVRPIEDDGTEVDPESGEIRKRRGRHPSPKFDVNPLWRSQNTQNPQKEGGGGSSEDFEDFEDASRRAA